jgi:hypothetical protein
MAMEWLLGDFDREVADRKSTLWLCVEVVVHMWIVGVVIYEMRLLVEAIPFFEGTFGFKRKHLASFTTGSVFVVMFIGFQRYLTQKLQYLYTNRLAQK